MSCLQKALHVGEWVGGALGKDNWGENNWGEGRHGGKEHDWRVEQLRDGRPQPTFNVVSYENCLGTQEFSPIH